jgi:hypothetical protein
MVILDEATRMSEVRVLKAMSEAAGELHGP